MPKMWVIRYDYEGEYQFPDCVFTTKEKALERAKEMEQIDEDDEDQEPQFSEVIEIDVDP